MLIKCPECEKEISDKSKQCIHCGYPLTETNNSNKNSLYKISLVGCTNDKIQMIKIVRETTGLGLAEAKSFVENIPQVIQKGLSYEKCIELQKVYDTYRATTSIEIDLESKDENEILNNINISSLKNTSYKNNAIKICPKCGSTEFTPLRRKWSLLAGFATNKIDMVCNNCGTIVKWG